MKRFDIRIILGGSLFVLGALMFMDKLGLFARLGLQGGVGGLFWGLVLLVFGGMFLTNFAQDLRRNWWAVIPGLTLVGLGVNAFLPKVMTGWGGAIFLGSIGLSFLIIYISNRAYWWAIIPAGVLLTLAAVSVVDMGDVAIGTGGIFFIGLGLTFLLVAVLPNPVGKMQWAYIPAAVLIAMGALLGNQATTGLTNYIWPVTLVLVGLILVFGFAFRKD